MATAAAHARRVVRCPQLPLPLRPYLYAYAYPYPYPYPYPYLFLYAKQVRGLLPDPPAQGSLTLP